MTDDSLTAREKRLLADLTRLAGDYCRNRQAAEVEADRARQTAETEFTQLVEQLDRRVESECLSADRQLSETRAQLDRQHEQQSELVHRIAEEQLHQTRAELERKEKQAAKDRQEATWLANSIFDGTRSRLKQQLRELGRQVEAPVQTARQARQQAEECLRRYGLARLVGQAEPGPLEPARGSLLPEQVVACAQQAEACLQQLRDLTWPRYTRGLGPIWVYGSILFLALPLCGVLAHWRPLPWLGPAALVTAVLGTALQFWLRRITRRAAGELYQALVTAVGRAEILGRRCFDQASAASKKHWREARRLRDQEFQRAEMVARPIEAECRRQRETELPRITERANQQLVAMQQEYDRQTAEAVSQHEQRVGEARERHQRARATAQLMVRQTELANQARSEAQRAQLEARWQTGLGAIRAELAGLEDEVEPLSVSWRKLAAGECPLPTATPPALFLGRLPIDVAALVPDAETLSVDQRQALRVRLPALVDFPSAASMVIKAPEAGRTRAVQWMQTVVFRMLSSLPPGKVRFTLIDPIGLGQNFAALMHLADFDEALIGHRIWTEPAQIEQRLADLTEHMETVIQKYLRDEYPTIEAYNLAAGEIAEPFRVLVVANFPHGFSEAAARRLLSIAASGPRCGVHLLISVDSRAPHVGGVRLSDLAQHATQFTAGSDKLLWHDPVFQQYPLEFTPIEPDLTKPLLQRVGAAALASRRVEVPFEAIAPAAEDYWRSDSRRGIEVPLGRSGATRLQHLRLGQGTSQHVLIAGKTGSGKSTLLHALITNAALRYSPADLELYLIDFKKGVEFKTYVTHQLPHARVVAIESEREFGLSVMQRLDAEMRDRGERFRAAGVQDLAGYRDAQGPLPRILLIVDEFQEFFVQDDRLAQEASLLLDRLVRQGRAFGIHVHLGSQTLGGAYSLARSTLGQMAVRIALQCSEADAHLILSDDNTAARLLSRPGEAIYNDANGLVEGNHPFQVVWLPDDRREVYLRRIEALAAAQPGPRRATIVFEGTQPADLERNEDWQQRLAAGAGGAWAEPATPTTAARPPEVWLGEPLAIDQATRAVFSRHSGANLLFLGQNDQAVAGMLVSGLLSLATSPEETRAEQSPGGPQFYVLNGSGPERGFAPVFGELAGALGSRLELAGAEQATQLVGRLAAELARRQAATELARRQAATEAEPPLFLWLLDVSRLRPLRRQEDDFSFSRSSDDRPRPDRQLAELLREGPALGIHVLAWCDTLTNFNRVFDRGLLKEFESRVLLQMSAADSSLLVDTPAASQLGRHRALLYQEDLGRLEKFRPFAAPRPDWLRQCAEQLQLGSSRRSAAPSDLDR